VIDDQNPDGAARQMDHLLTAVAENRDKEAFRDLFETFAPRIRAFIGRQGTDSETVEEVVQETFVSVWKKAHLFDPGKASASTWMFAIARNARVDLLRKVNRPALDPDDPALVADPEPSAHQLVSRSQEAARLKEVMALLPPEQQEVLRLAFFEEKAHGKVAEELGIPLGTVKSRIRLALGRIRSELGDLR
jgi:RNA polymerase sigma factor (sigma-70 family)